MSDKANIGVIGSGYWGPNLIRNFVELPGAHVRAVADLEPDRLSAICVRFPQIPLTTQNYRDLFELDLDAVVIATPPDTHHAIARECLENNLHVLVEKPVTLNSADAYDLKNLAEERGLVLMVGHTFEYNPAVRFLKELIDSGELGEIYYVDAVRVSLGLYQTKANVLWDLAPHDISILRYILGAEPVAVHARGNSFVHEGVEDIVYTLLKFPGNVLAHMRLSWLDPRKTRQFTVVGSEKMVIYDDVSALEKIQIYDKRVKVIRRTETFGDFSFAYHYGDVVIPHIQHQEPLRVQCGHFLECITEGRQPLTDGYSGARVVQILEAAQRSLSDSGRQFEIASNGHATREGSLEFAVVNA
jgi:predicted dehydrogenase